ncbi:MAG: exodeoxyribonuclease VII small subunit [Deltaproteobacteria bacterium]|jgi:exodeoxyribonuclease VII small subunit|nr:exodeoxyribonuclease VII small subunit [Deltaproteobacteria bacterium]
MSDKTKKDLDSFEAGLERLEALVASLENKEQSLDVALKAFEEGVTLSRELSAKLKKAETRLETIAKGLEGEPIASPLELDDLDGKEKK